MGYTQHLSTGSKAVRWADGGCPPTPSPTFSQSTLPSSVGALTPPPSLQWPPSPSNPTTQIHPLLCASSHPALLYDVSKIPHTVLPRDKTMTSAILQSCATNIPLASMSLRCKGLPWPILITADARRGFITVYDVLEGIYRALRTPATKAEFESVPTIAAQEAVQKAFATRYRRFAAEPALMQLEKGKGLKRVDFLCDRTRFLGLRAIAGKGQAEWELLLA